MKPIEYNRSKNELLMETRNISFEDFIGHINNGEYRVFKNKNYPNQRIFLIEHNNYPYCIPFVEDEKKIFLKTIYPNRKFKKEFL